MVYTSRGIVLQMTDYSESSRIVHVYTDLLGRKSFLAKGIRKGKSKNKAFSAIQPGFLVELTASENKKSSMEILCGMKVIQPFEEIPFLLNKTVILLFMNELMTRSIKEEEPNSALFQFLVSEILLLDKTQEPLGEFPLVFLLRFADKIGFCPMNNFHTVHAPYFHLQSGCFVFDFVAPKETMSREESAALHALLENMEQGTYHFSGIPYALRMQLLQQLLSFYQLHVLGQGVIKSHEVLHSVLQ